MNTIILSNGTCLPCRTGEVADTSRRSCVAPGTYYGYGRGYYNAGTYYDNRYPTVVAPVVEEPKDTCGPREYFNDVCMGWVKLYGTMYGKSEGVYEQHPTDKVNG